MNTVLFTVLREERGMVGEEERMGRRGEDAVDCWTHSSPAQKI